MHRSTALLILAAVVGGCGDRQVVALLEGLPASATRVGMILLDADKRPIAASALGPLETAHSISIGEITDGDELLVVAYSDEDLGQVELPDVAAIESAAIRIASELDIGVLPRPTWSGSTLIEGDRASVAELGVPLEVTADWAPPCGQDACALVPFDVPNLFELSGSNDGANVAVPWDLRAERALASVGPVLYEVTEQGVIPLTDLSTATVYLSGVLLPDERILLMSNGSLAVGRPETGFVEVESTITWIRPQAIDASLQGAEPEAFIVMADGSLARWTDAGLETVLELGLPQTGADVAWLGPQQALLSFRGSDLVVHYDAGRVTRYSATTPTGVAVVEGLGALVSAGGPGGEILRFTGEGLELLSALPDEQVYDVRDIYPVSDGRFLYGGSRGEYAYQVAGLGDCTLPTFAFRTFNDVARIDSGLVIALGRGDMLDSALVAHLPFQPVPLACPSR